MPDIPFDDLLTAEQPYGLQDGRFTYAAVIDPVSCPDLFDLIPDLTTPYVMLAGEHPAAGCERVVPYLVSFPQRRDDPLFSLIRNNLGKESGIVIKFADDDTHDFSRLASHCNTIPYVKMPDNKMAYLRYYDPHILISYMKIAYPEQLSVFFGDGIVEVFAEDVENRIVRSFQRTTLPKSTEIPQLDPEQVEFLLQSQYDKFVWILYCEIMSRFYPDVPVASSDVYKQNVYTLVDLSEQNGILTRSGLYEFVSLCAEKNCLHRHTFIEELLKEAIGTEDKKISYVSEKIREYAVPNPA